MIKHPLTGILDFNHFPGAGSYQKLSEITFEGSIFKTRPVNFFSTNFFLEK